MQSICREENCEQPISNRETQLCHKHHFRFIRNGTTEIRPKIDKSKKCKVDGCDRGQVSSTETCLMHYKRWKRYGTFEIPKKTNWNEVKCKFCDSNVGKHGALGMCCKHYQMFKLHGDPLHVEKRRSEPGYYGYYRDTDGVRFHRRVAEKTIGRELIKGVEVVHHIDLDKTNNNPSNL